MSTSRSIRVDATPRGPAARTVCRLLVAAAAIGIEPAPVHAHGFGQRYDLPLPLSLYLVGTAAAIVFSFVIVGLFVRRAPRTESYPHLELRGPLLRLIASPAISLLLKLLVLCLWLVTVLAGFVGNTNPYQNVAPTLVWIIGWVGLAYVSAFIGNLWALVNPWRTAFDLARRFYQRARRQPGLSRRLTYPKALGVWPAFALLLAFSWTGSSTQARRCRRISRGCWSAIRFSPDRHGRVRRRGMAPAWRALHRALQPAGPVRADRSAGRGPGRVRAMRRRLP